MNICTGERIGLIITSGLVSQSDVVNEIRQDFCFSL